MDPLRILLALEPSGGGSGRHVADLAQGLVERGHKVVLAHGVSRAEPAFLDRIGSIDGLQCVAQPDLKRAIGLHDVRARSSLAALVQELGPFDILHGHSSKAGALVRLLPGSISGKRIYTPHAFRTMDPTISLPAKLVYGQIERALSHASDQIIAVSEDEYAHARTIGVHKHKLTQVLNGADPRPHRSRDTVRAELGLAPQEYAVVFVGRLSAQKDPLRFAAALAQVRKRRPDIRGIMIGDGEMMSDLKAQVGDQTGIDVLGHRDAEPLLGGFDLFMMTSRYEAFPYTYIEALHAGLPILTTSVGGARDATGKDNGAIVALDASADALANALDRLCQRDKLATMSLGSQALAPDFTVSHMVSATERVYRAALGETSLE